METWFWILGWSLSILTITGNGFIIYLVCSRWRLRTKTNAFIVSLAVADFCVGLTTVPSLFVCEKTTRCDPEALFADGMDFLRWLFVYASATNLCSLVLDRYIAVVKPLRYLLFMTRKRVSQMIFISWTLSILVIFFDVVIWLLSKDKRSLFLISSWIIVIFLEFLPCCSLIFCFGTMLHIVYKHQRAARMLTKQLRFNQRFLSRSGEKSAAKVMGIVICLFTLTYTFSLRCSLAHILQSKQTCNDKEYKIPLLVLNSAVNPVAYAFFKRDLKEQVERCICCVFWKKRNNIEPLNDLRFFPNSCDRNVRRTSRIE
ncbi:octopamine receptor beta-2R-like [Stylophora pistillata]|uniref:octopamine receptor beta-2R-like n=1 Tax=Stylophora pistillata TaxID=50429 RepID=UPI000C044406|nr:octopamine receptor beta-2R-like [Stylophora pistillata]